MSWTWSRRFHRYGPRAACGHAYCTWPGGSPSSCAYTGPTADSPVLAAASLREMHKPRYLADDDWTSAWGISWYADRQDGVSWIGHSGGLPGFTTSVRFDPGQQVGAIVLHNGPSFT